MSSSKWHNEFQVRPEDRLQAQKASLLDLKYLKKYLVMFAVLIAVLGFVWYTMTPNASVSDRDLPVIKAPEGPYKIKSDTQELDKQSSHNKTIYEKLAAKKPDEKVEHLLKEPEEPIATLPSLPEDFIGNLMNDESLEDEASPLKPVSTLESSSPEIEFVEEKPTVKMPENVPNKAQLPIKPQLDAKISPNQTLGKDTKSGTHWVQLASVRSQESAQQEWKRLNSLSRLKPLLGSFKPVYGRVDMGESEGIRYRLRVGLLCYEAARDLCAKLKEHKVDCIVKKNQ